MRNMDGNLIRIQKTMKRAPKIYATLQRSFRTAELRRLGFRIEAASGEMTKRGAGRALLATASSLNGEIWRVTPYARRWR